MRRTLLALAVAIGMSVLAACGDDGPTAAPPQAGCREASADGSVTVVAEDLAWDTDCLSLPADTDVTIIVDNQDEGVNHNIHVVGLPDAAPKTKLEPGPIRQELEVRVPAGDYTFVCDLHPNMKGDLRAG